VKTEDYTMNESGERVRKFSIGDIVGVFKGGVRCDNWGTVTVTGLARNHTYVLHLGNSNTTVHAYEYELYPLGEV